MVFHSDESYFWDIYPKLRTAIQRLKGARLVHERVPDGGPTWFDDSDPEEDPADGEVRPRSYYLFFVCPEADEFTYESEIKSLARPACEEDWNEDETPMETVAESGRTGWTVAVSLLAPFAVVTLSNIEALEDGSATEPSIESHGFTETGQPINEEAAFRESKGEQAFEILLKLRGRICDTLSRYGIAVLPEEEWRKPVPWLRTDVFVRVGEPVRVLDALFFEGL
ncbi:MAG: hypothetical protein ABSG79_21480 [Bryobacteraceae bacterium]|jgi:hypothetical protein